MNDQIITLVQSIKNDRESLSLEKPAIKQGIIIRLLSYLKWDIFNVREVKPDISIGSYCVDYGLAPNGDIGIYIKVAGPNEKLNRYETDLLDAAEKEAVDLSILTNARYWWFYLTSTTVKAESGKFLSLDLQENDPKRISRFIDLLGKESVLNGRAVKTAEMLSQRRRQERIEKTMADVWGKMLSEPNHTLVELLQRGVKDTCGLTAEQRLIENFLVKAKENGRSNTAPASSQILSDLLNVADDPSMVHNPDDTLIDNATSLLEFHKNSLESAQDPPVPDIVANKKSYRFSDAPNPSEERIISSFSIVDTSYEVESWFDFLIALCEAIASTHSDDFNKVLWHTNEGGYFFSNNPRDLRSPGQIGSTDLFVETDFTPNKMIEKAHYILSIFDYSKDDLKITLK